MISSGVITSFDSSLRALGSVAIRPFVAVAFSAAALAFLGSPTVRRRAALSCDRRMECVDSGSCVGGWAPRNPIEDRLRPQTSQTHPPLMPGRQTQTAVDHAVPIRAQALSMTSKHALHRWPHPPTNDTCRSGRCACHAMCCTAALLLLLSNDHCGQQRRMGRRREQSRAQQSRSRIVVITLSTLDQTLDDHSQERRSQSNRPPSSPPVTWTATRHMMRFDMRVHRRAHSSH